MRYAFSDLLRYAQIDRVTRKAMIGHVSDGMQEHYSTVHLDEERDAMNAVAEKLKEERLTVLKGVGVTQGVTHPRKGKAA